MVKYTTRYIRKADRVYDPKDPYRFCYEHITPEAEAEFERLVGNGPIAFTRPKAAPAAAAETSPAAEQTPPQAKPPRAAKPRTTRRSRPQR